MSVGNGVCVLSLWTWCCIHSLEIVFSDCSNSSMEFYRASLCGRHSTAFSTKESFGREPQVNAEMP